MKKTVKKVIAIALVLSTLLTLCSCTSIGSEKINVEDYIEIIYDGFSGEADCRIDVDYEGMNALVDIDARNKKIAKLAKEYEIDTEDILVDWSDMDSWIYVSLAENYEDISNGDKLKVIVEVSGRTADMFGFTMEDVEEILGVKFSGTEIEIEATGIKEYITIDIFSEIEKYFYVDENAVSGETYLSLNIPNDFEVQFGGLTLKTGANYRDVNFYEGDNYLGSVNVICDEELTSEETYEVVLEYRDFYLASIEYYGYQVEPMSKTYTAPEFKYERITSKDDITAENIDYLKSLVKNSIAEEMESGQIIDLYYYKTTSSYRDFESGFVAIVCGKNPSDSDTYYTDFTADDVLIDKDGNITAKFTKYGLWNSYGKYDTYEDAYNMGLDHTIYTYEKIA